MDSRRAKFIITEDASRPKTPYKLEIRAWFAGKKIRRWCVSEGVALQRAEELVDLIQTQGTRALDSHGMKVAEATKLFRKRFAGKSKSHEQKGLQICDILDSELGSIRMQNVSASTLESIMMSVSDNSTSQAARYRYLRMFFRWAWRFKHISDNPMTALDAPRARSKSEILTPQMMKDVLEDPDEEIWLKRAILIGGCGGLRTAEIERMELADFDVKSKQIHIRPGVQKDSGGSFERIVDFTPPMARRLEWFKEGELLPCGVRMLHKHRRMLAARMAKKHPERWNAKWPDNCLRHSYATYHLAKCKNPSLTAYQMGHTSPSMVQRVYAVAAKKADWKKWWAL